MTTEAAMWKAVGGMIRDSIERSYGKKWKSTLSTDVAKAIVAREAFFITLGNVSETGTAADLRDHGRACYNAGLAACDIKDEE